MSLSSLTRREVVVGLSSGLTGLAVTTRGRRAGAVTRQRADGPPRPHAASVLPDGVRSRIVEGINGLRMHVLEAGDAGRPGVLLLHGFPELAYSWRRLLPPLADAGFHAVAPDLRGYGRTDGTAVAFDDDLRPYRMLNHIRDQLSLVAAFGHRSVHLAGHDFGALVASWCAVARPDVFRTVTLMSAPFAGTATLPFDTANRPAVPPAPAEDLDAALAALTPPRRHYRRFYATRGANDDMWRAPQGVHDFLRGYYHMKSGDWPGNQPEPLGAWTASELARLPRYYVLHRHQGMAETVAAEMPTAAEIAACDWLPDDELRVYSGEYERTGFQGGLQWYRSNTSVASIFAGSSLNADLQVFAGRTIDQPSLFIAGRRDWGIYQRPGSLEQMRTTACTDLRALHLLEGAGHWVQQEASTEVTALLLDFLTAA